MRVNNFKFKELKKLTKYYTAFKIIIMENLISWEKEEGNIRHRTCYPNLSTEHAILPNHYIMSYLQNNILAVLIPGIKLVNNDRKHDTPELNYLSSNYPPQ